MIKFITEKPEDNLYFKRNLVCFKSIISTNSWKCVNMLFLSTLKLPFRTFSIGNL